MIFRDTVYYLLLSFIDKIDFSLNESTGRLGHLVRSCTDENFNFFEHTVDSRFIRVRIKDRTHLNEYRYFKVKSFINKT